MRWQTAAHKQRRHININGLIPIHIMGIYMIKCEICSKKLKAITHTHLRVKHGMTTGDYSKIYPNSPTTWSKGLTIETDERVKRFVEHPNVMKNRFKKGQHPSPSTEFYKGFKHTEETKAKMKGRMPWNKGLTKEDDARLKASLERKNKISIKMRGKSTKWLKGRKQPKELVEKRIKRMMEVGGGYQKGKKHPNWKGGITSERGRIHSSREYKDWRRKVFEHDNHTCQRCNIRGGNLHAHHIKPFSEHPESRFDINNGVTLCKECHKKIHANNGGS